MDYKKFKQTVTFDTPLCSAKKLADIQKRLYQTEISTITTSDENK